MFLIFDGCSGSEKSDVEQERLLDREEQRRLGNALQCKGDSDGAAKAFQAATEITADIAMDVVVYLRNLSAARRKELGIEACLTALGEADPLLTFVQLRIPNSAIVSMDFDNVPWGATKVLLKVDYTNGCVDLFDRDTFKAKAKVGRRDFSDVSDEQLIDMCVLAGCDYCPSLHKVGFATAFNAVIKYGRGPRVLYHWKKNGFRECDEAYCAKALRAMTIFRYQRVVCPFTRVFCHMRTLPDKKDIYRLKKFDVIKNLDPPPPLDIVHIYMIHNW